METVLAILPTFSAYPAVIVTPKRFCLRRKDTVSRAIEYATRLRMPGSQHVPQDEMVNLHTARLNR